MNEMLRRALFRARLSEEDVAAHLGVDPKTVRRWLEGRVPYPRHRQAMSHLLGTDEADLWPEVHADRGERSWPNEIKAVYPHRWAVPNEVWHQLFSSAEHEIDVLTYSDLLLAMDAVILGVFANKASAGVRVRIALGDPGSPYVAGCGLEDIDDAVAAKIREALALYRSLADMRNLEIRLHRATLYNSLYRADNNLLVNQHAYGIPAGNAPVFHLRREVSSDMFRGYEGSFRRIWTASEQPD